MVGGETDNDKKEILEPSCTSDSDEGKTHKSTSMYATDASILANETLPGEEWKETAIERIPLTDYIVGHWNRHNLMESNVEKPNGAFQMGNSLATDGNLDKNEPKQATKFSNLFATTGNSYDNLYREKCKTTESSKEFRFRRPNTQLETQHIRSDIMMRPIRPAPRDQKQFERWPSTIAGPIVCPYPRRPAMEFPLFETVPAAEFRPQSQRPLDRYSMPQRYDMNIQFYNERPQCHSCVPWSAPSNDTFKQFTTTLPQNMMPFNKGQTSFIADTQVGKLPQTSNLSIDSNNSTSHRGLSFGRHPVPISESPADNYARVGHGRTMHGSETLLRSQLRKTHFTNTSETNQAEFQSGFEKNALYFQKCQSEKTRSNSLPTSRSNVITSADNFSTIRKASSAGDCPSLHVMESAANKRERYFSEDGQLCCTSSEAIETGNLGKFPILTRSCPNSPTEHSNTSEPQEICHLNREIGSHGAENSPDDDISEKSPQNYRSLVNLTPHEEKIFKMSTLDFTKLIQKSNDSEANQLKKLRRTLKNRNYATQCRMKRNKQFDILQMNYRDIQFKYKRQSNKMNLLLRDNINLTKENMALSKQMSEWERKVTQLKAENEGLHNFITELLSKSNGQSKPE